MPIKSKTKNNKNNNNKTAKTDTNTIFNGTRKLSKKIVKKKIN